MKSSLKPMACNRIKGEILSMSRDKNLYIDDILDSAGVIKEFVAQMNFEEFKNDRKTYSATLEILPFVNILALAPGRYGI